MQIEFNSFKNMDTAEKERLCDEEDEPLHMTENGSERFVVIDAETYRKLEDKLRELYEANSLMQGTENGRQEPNFKDILKL